MIDRVNILEGDWVDKSYTSRIFPFVKNLPISRESVIPIINIHDPIYWRQLKDNPPTISVLDYRHWDYDGNAFYDYIQHVTAASLPYLCIAEHPYGCERPQQVDLHSYEKELYRRTKVIYDLMKAKSPLTRIISPPIRSLEPKLQSKYIDYFIQNRSIFDVYAVHCCLETNDHSLGLLSSFLHQILKVSQKPVWVTRWSVPCCDEKIQNRDLLAETEWKQLSAIEAAVKLKTMYSTLTDVAQNNINWFFVGTSSDMYHPNKKPPGLWDSNRVYLSDEMSPQWKPEHFIGGATWEEKVKMPIINAVLELYKKSCTPV